jgi:hypothetical protein
VLEPPFDLVRCSWPRPVEHADGRWVSAPDWDAPPMPSPYWPQPRWSVVDDELCWMIDWRDLFRSGVPGKWQPAGRMRGFHVVFRLRVRGGGRLAFWDDDGCLVRRNGELVHQDRSSHRLTRHAIDVGDGDILEIAQWQASGHGAGVRAGTDRRPTTGRWVSSRRTLPPSKGGWAGPRARR